MSAQYFEQCQGGIGRAVELRCHDGVVHRGIIERVEPDGVWLSHLPAGAGFDGPGVHLWGGLGWWLVPFAAVTALAWLPWLWW